MGYEARRAARPFCLTWGVKAAGSGKGGWAEVGGRSEVGRSGAELGRDLASPFSSPPSLGSQGRSRCRMLLSEFTESQADFHLGETLSQRLEVDAQSPGKSSGGGF